MNEIEKECWECKQCLTLEEHETTCLPFRTTIAVNDAYLKMKMEYNRRKLKA